MNQKRETAPNNQDREPVFDQFTAIRDLEWTISQMKMHLARVRYAAEHGYDVDQLLKVVSTMESRSGTFHGEIQKLRKQLQVFKTIK